VNDVPVPKRFDAVQLGPAPLGLVASLLLFGGAGLLLFVATRVAIPLLIRTTGCEGVIAWFAAAGFGVFLPLVIIGWVMLRREGMSDGRRLWSERLRFRRLTAADLGWTQGDLGCALAGLAIVGLGSAATIGALRWWSPDIRLHPSFLAMEPLGPGRYWIFAVWLPFFAINILGEEFLWRGVVLPRQERALGRHAWAANGAGWLLFHLPFGPTILVMLVPVVFLIPYLVQRRGNTWIGVALHAAINGPGFIAVALGGV